MKQKITKRIFVRTLFMVPPMALVLCATSQFVRYGTIQTDLLAKSLPIGFLCAFFCNLCLPLGENALWAVKHLPISPKSRRFGLLVSFFFSMQFAAIMTGVMCFYNVVLLAHQEIFVFLKSWAKVYIPCLCMAYLVSSLWKPWAERISWKLVPLKEDVEMPVVPAEEIKQSMVEKAFPCLPGEPCIETTEAMH